MEESKEVSKEVKEGNLTFNEVLGEYLTKEQAKEIVSKLEDNLKKNEKDENLKVVITKLKSYYEKKPKNKKYTIQKIILISLVIFHFFIILGNILAVFILPFLTPWYISIPLISLIINLNFTPTKCPLTVLEDKIRISMGLPEIKLFIKHYIIIPYLKWKKKRKKERN